uniref:DNA replication complex GINS protein SLD5 n=1 Tax=Strongyloides stercoralis TaxID=6248 RepID=A0A0K0ECZ0_STRER
MDSGENSINDDQFELEYQGTEDAEHMTCTEIIQKMVKIWHNQYLAPDLLIHRYEIVDAMLEVANQEKEKIDEIKMEVLRIQYMIKSYINKRLKLIEENPLHYLNIDTKLRTEGKEELMDFRERNHCKKFVELYDNHMHNEVLSDLEGFFSSKPIASKKPSCARVIAKVVDDSIKHFEIPDYNSPGTSLSYDVEIESIHAIPWSVVSDFVNSGKVDLM